MRAGRFITQFSGGLPSLSGDYLVDFTQMADGTPGAAVTGEATLRDTTSSDPNRVTAYVAGGALVCDASGTGVTGAYTGAKLPEDIKSVYADVSFGASGDTLVLIANDQPLLTSITATSVHVTFGRDSWQIGYFSAGSLTNVETGTFDAVPIGKKVRCGWRLVGNDFYLLLPNRREIGPYTSEAVATRRSHSVIFEHYHGTATPSLKIYKVAANLFATPTASGRTNLITPNSLSTWTRNQMGTPTSGQPDSDGGTSADRVFETATTTTHYVLTSVDKAAEAKRYSLRAKMKLINRDWIMMSAYDQAFSGQASRYLKLTDQTFGTQSGTFTDQSWMVYSLGDGWCQVQVDFKSNTGTKIQPRFATASADGTSSLAGATDAGFYMHDQWLYERPV